MPNEAINRGASPLQAKLRQAVALHQKGLLARAQILYEEILRVEPGHFDALHLSGVIAVQTGEPEKALELIDRAIQIESEHAPAHVNRGFALKELKQLDAALASYTRAIAIKADAVEAHYNRGIVLHELKQLDAALASYERALVLKPDLAEGHCNRGNVLCELEQPEAAASFDRAIAIRTDYAEAHFNRSKVLKVLGRLEEALASCDRTISIKADYAEAYANRGNVQRELGQLDAALASYDRAISLKGDFAEAYFSRGIVLRRLGQVDAALSSYNQAIVFKASYAEAYANRGTVLRELGQFDAALTSYDRALATKTDFAEAYCNRGTLLHELGQFDLASASYDQAIAVKPDFSQAHFNKSISLLTRADFANGWAGYEWRTKALRHFPLPCWHGPEPLPGKTILLHSEQGLGDTIQFCRYAKLVSNLGARVILETQEPLIGLLATLEGVSQIVCRGNPLPAFDCHCPLLSLPLAFNTNLGSIPRSIRYLRSDAGKVAQWQARLGPKLRPRIGLVWSGNAEFTNDRNRSLSIAELVEHLPGEFHYICLQKEVREIDRQILVARGQITSFADDLADFTDTAALCECMDLVISVDTSVAHLSGALGKTTWLLLPFNSDWRWLLDRDDSPWYPTMKLYRQDRPGHWSGLLAQMARNLVQLFR